MYTERQAGTTAWLRGLRALLLGVFLAQTMGFAAAEMGLLQLPLGRSAHVLLLLLAGMLFGMLWQAGLMLRVGVEGLALRFLPWQWRWRHVRWPEIRQIRLLPPGTLLPGARFGMPAQDFTHAYWLSNPGLRVVCVELVNGMHLYMTTARPTELLDFLQHGLVTVNKSVLKLE